MIRINLLSTFSTGGADVEDASFVQSDERRQIYTDFAKRFMVFIIGPLGLYFYEASNLPKLEGQLAAKRQSVIELEEFNTKMKGLAEEIKRYEEDQIRLNDQMNFMRKIAADKVNEVKLFVYLQDFTPDSVWINRLELKGIELSINAESDVPADITKFLDNLTNAQFLAGVSPVNQETKVNSLGDGVTTTNFNVKASFANGVPPQ